MESQKTVQKRLFHDSPEDAATTDILACGGWKEVGHALRPDLTPQNAAAWARCCCNPDRAERFNPGQWILIKLMAKRNNSFAIVEYENQTLGCETKWLDPENEREQLQREFIDSVQLQRKLLERLEQLQSPHLRVAK